jgi:ABC-type transport system, involved in lipoprotein release, permease component
MGRNKEEKQMRGYEQRAVRRIFRNNNREAVRELAMDNYYAHKTRNRVAVLAIVLTTILITAIFTVGISWVSTIVNYGESAPGPGCEGALSAGKEHLEKIRELPCVAYADYTKKCSVSPLLNEEFAGIEVWLFAAEESYLEHNFVKLIEGNYPKEAGEILISDAMARRLGLTGESGGAAGSPVGKRLSLRVKVAGEEQPHEMTEKDFDFTVCGYFKNPLVSLENVYDEVYTTEDFIREHNPSMLEREGQVYIHLNNLNPLLMKSDVMEKLTEVSRAAGCGGIQTKYTTDLAGTLLGVFPALLLVLLLMLGGYFLIYNIFYISVAADIRWFGMIKTIGTTPGQLKKILLIQIRRLGLIGICAGDGIGYLIGNLLGPGVMSHTVYGQFYEAPPVIPILLLGAGFSWLTIRISAGTAMKTACSVSPVEAARFEPGKKRNIFTILSLTLSIIIFVVVSNATLGYSVDKMVARYNQEQGRIMHKGSKWWLREEPYAPVSKSLVEEIRALPFVSGVDVIYRARTQPDYVEYGGSREYLHSLGRVKLEGRLKEWREAMRSCPEYGEIYDEDLEKINFSETDVYLEVLGLPAGRLMKNMPYLQILEGELNPEDFATGEYIVWQEMQTNQGLSGKEWREKQIHAGEELTLQFWDDGTESYVSRQVKVMAVVEHSDPFGTSDIDYSNVIIPDTMFREIYSDYEERIVSLQIMGETEFTKEQNGQIQGILAREYNTQLMMESRYLSRSDAQYNKYTMTFGGLFLTVLLGIIGISNVINTLTSDVFARRRELAALQSIGMTVKQLKGMLFKEAMKYCFPAVLLAVPAGGVLAFMVAGNWTFTGFSPALFIMASAGAALVISGIALLATDILVKNLNRKSIVERLREIE